MDSFINKIGLLFLCAGLTSNLQAMQPRSSREVRIRALQSLYVRPQAFEEQLLAPCDPIKPDTPEQREAKTLALLEWIQRGNHMIVEYLARHGADIHAATEHGPEAALKLAVSTSNLQIAQCLLQNGANVNAPDKNGRPGAALKLAVTTGFQSMVECLIEYGADVHAPDENGPDAPLRLAAAAGHLPIVQCLLQNDANVHAANDAALRFAAATGKRDVVHYLAGHNTCLTALLVAQAIAVNHDQDDVVEYLSRAIAEHRGAEGLS